MFQYNGEPVLGPQNASELKELIGGDNFDSISFLLLMRNLVDDYYDDFNAEDKLDGVEDGNSLERNRNNDIAQAAFIAVELHSIASQQGEWVPSEQFPNQTNLAYLLMHMNEDYRAPEEVNA